MKTPLTDIIQERYENQTANIEDILDLARELEDQRNSLLEMLEMVVYEPTSLRKLADAEDLIATIHRADTQI
jgi:hypothetical protein